MKKKTIEFLSFVYIALFLVLMINFVIKTFYGGMSLKNYSQYIYISGELGLLLYISSKIKNFKFNKYEIIIFIMILLSCLSLISAINIHTAIFGNLNRYEGLLVWLSYYIFILNAMYIKNKKYICIIILLISTYVLTNVIYGLYQVGILNPPNWLYVFSKEYYASGFLGHSNFFGSISTIFYGLVLGLFVKTEMGWKKYLLGIILLIANLGVLINGAMSAIVTVIAINVVVFIQTIVLIIKKRKNSYVYLGSLIVGIISFVLVYSIYTSNNTQLKKDTQKLFSETKEVVVDKNANEDYGTGRIYIWKNTIEKIKEAPITGYGIDNFQNVFKSKLIAYGSIVDKAHNDYLQKALCEGIISGIVFVVFLLMIFFKGIARKLSPIYYGLLLAFTCYSIQAFFNISFINVAPIYFIIMGLLIGTLKEKEDII